MKSMIGCASWQKRHQNSRLWCFAQFLGRIQAHENVLAEKEIRHDATTRSRKQGIAIKAKRKVSAEYASHAKSDEETNTKEKLDKDMALLMLQQI